VCLGWFAMAYSLYLVIESVRLDDNWTATPFVNPLPASKTGKPLA
jgi:hypothetical protein